MKKLIICILVFITLSTLVYADELPEKVQKRRVLRSYVLLEIDAFTDETISLGNKKEDEYTKVNCRVLYDHLTSTFANDHKPSYLKEVFIPTVNLQDICQEDIILTRINSIEDFCYYCPSYSEKGAEYIRFVGGRAQFDADILKNTETLQPLQYLNYESVTSKENGFSVLEFEEGIDVNDLILWLNERKNYNDSQWDPWKETTANSYNKAIEKTGVLSWPWNFNNSGRDVYISEYAQYCTKYVTDFYGIEAFVADLVEKDTLKSFLRPFYEKERSLWELTVLSAVKEMNIPKSVFIKANAENGSVFTDEQIEALYSGDEVALNRAFVSPWALTANGKIFTPDWLAVHTASDYKKNGITFDTLLEYIKKIDTPELASFCVPIAFAMEEMNADFDAYSIEQVKNAPYPRAFYLVSDKIRVHIDDAEYENITSRYIIEDNEAPSHIQFFNMTSYRSLFPNLDGSLERLLYDNFSAPLFLDGEMTKYRIDKESGDMTYTVGEKEIALALITQYENYLSFLNDHGLDAITEDEYYSEEELLIVERYRERYR